MCDYTDYKHKVLYSKSVIVNNKKNHIVETLKITTHRNRKVYKLKKNAEKEVKSLTMGNEKKSKPFVVFKTKQELMMSEEQNQLELETKVKEELTSFDYKLTDVFGATVTLDSPPKVVAVKLIKDPSEFIELAF